MAFTVSKVEVWSCEIADQPGGLAGVLEPLAKAGVDLQTVIARRQPDKPGTGIVFLGPIRGRKAQDAAKAAGLSVATDLAALRIEGTNKPGIGHQMTSALAAAGINIRGVFATVFGNRFVALFAFDTAADANKAAGILRRLGARRK